MPAFHVPHNSNVEKHDIHKTAFSVVWFICILGDSKEQRALGQRSRLQVPAPLAGNRPAHINRWVLFARPVYTNTDTIFFVQNIVNQLKKIAELTGWNANPEFSKIVVAYDLGIWK